MAALAAIADIISSIVTTLIETTLKYMIVIFIITAIMVFLLSVVQVEGADMNGMISTHSALAWIFYYIGQFFSEMYSGFTNL